MKMSWLKRWFRDHDGALEEGVALNVQTRKRNLLITLSGLAVLLMIGTISYRYLRGSEAVAASETVIEFGSIIDVGFTEKDNQSALSAQQAELDEQIKLLGRMEKMLAEMEAHQEHFTSSQSERQERFENKLYDRFEALKNNVTEAVPAVIDGASTPIDGEQPAIPYVPLQSDAGTPTTVPFNTRYHIPPRPQPQSYDNPQAKDFTYQSPSESPFRNDGIDSFSFVWDEDDAEQGRRTIENYVPTGTFVTAVVTGGADADAGALGQSNTVPMVFQTVNAGVLPNGKPSRLNNCTVTGAAHGEISSSRGIVRTNRLSCIYEDDEIVDVAVKGTVFNFGRNGIRGTTILKNGKIIQMAGVSGILTGLGETGKAMAQTTSTSALGSTATINSDDAALNMLGNATESVGSKLADYYIKLANLYHPIVELNPGNIVNIVFLEGFPLDAEGIANYDVAQAPVIDSANNQRYETITTNPLQEQVMGLNTTAEQTAFGTPQPRGY